MPDPLTLALAPAIPRWRATAQAHGAPQHPVWVLTSGEAGMRAQALGLAERLELPYLEFAADLAAPWRWLPAPWCAEAWRFADPPLCAEEESALVTALWQRWQQRARTPVSVALPAAADALELPPLQPLLQANALAVAPLAPALLIACGRRVQAVALWLREQLPSRPPILYVQDPRLAPSHFDWVIAPQHDPVRGANVVLTPTALHRITAARLAAARAHWLPRWKHLPRPWWGLIVGGPSRSVRWSEATAHTAIAAFLDRAAAAGATVLATTSRRTPAATRAWLKAHLPDAYCGEGENPYLGILACTEHRAVTSDSVSMLSETLAAPGTSERLEVGRYRARLQRFHAAFDAALRLQRGTS